MKLTKNFWFFIAGLILGGLLCLSFINTMKFLFGSVSQSIPKIAGQKVPSQPFELDFSKRYNITIDTRSGARDYKDCLIKGFTKPRDEISPRYRYFSSWIVLERTDGRIVYLPPHNIVAIEGTQP